MSKAVDHPRAAVANMPIISLATSSRAQRSMNPQWIEPERAERCRSPAVASCRLNHGGRALLFHGKKKYRRRSAARQPW